MAYETLPALRYWQAHETAVRHATRKARQNRLRYRVQRVTWAPPADAHPQSKWYVCPTPAPSPSRVAAEPCS